MIKSNHWFMKNCVFSEDPVDTLRPVKPAPYEKDYIKQVISLWNSPAGRKMAMEKSRRMWMTWLFVALHTHLALTSRHGRIFFISKKEQDADELIERAKFILESIPEEKIPKAMLPTWKKTYCEIYFPELKTLIQGVPQGSDQLRQYASTAVLWDECAFHETAEETYASLAPTLLALHATGRLTIVSSVLPGTLFQKIIHDTLT